MKSCKVIAILLILTSSISMQAGWEVDPEDDLKWRGLLDYDYAKNQASNEKISISEIEREFTEMQIDQGVPPLHQICPQAKNLQNLLTKRKRGQMSKKNEE